MWIARQDGLIVTNSGEDTLVYDQERQELHHLNPLAALVWRVADGQTSTTVMLDRAREMIDSGVSAGAIDEALRLLADANLVAGRTPMPAMQSRRRLLREVALGAVVLPTVVSVTAPLAAAASSVTCVRPPQPYLEVQFRKNDLGRCNVSVFIARYCPITEYTASLVVQAFGSDSIHQAWPVTILTDGDGYGRVLVTDWPEITAWVFTATVGSLSYGPVSSYCPN